MDKRQLSEKMYSKRFHQLLIIPLLTVLLVFFAFANSWKIKHLDISVAFTNAFAIEETYVQWPTNLPPDLIPGIQAVGYSRLNNMDQNQLQDYGINV